MDSEGYYHILGRMSADIIKSGGYKVGQGGQCVKSGTMRVEAPC
jgi:hypothetical protein